MRAFLGFLKAIATGVGISAMLGALVGIMDFPSFSNVVTGAVVGTILTSPGIVIGGLVYRLYVLTRRQRPVKRWVPALMSAALILVCLLAVYTESHRIRGDGCNLAGLYLVLMYASVLATIAALFGAGVGQR